MKVLGIDFILRSGECREQELSLVVVNEDKDIEMVNQIKTEQSSEEIAKTIIEIFDQYNCNKLVIDRGFGFQTYLELSKVAPKNSLIGYVPTREFNHSMLRSLQETKILSEWGVSLEFNVINGNLKLQEGCYGDKKKWLSFAMATGLALITIIGDSKEKHESEKLKETLKSLDINTLKENIDIRIEAEAYMECELKKIRGEKLNPVALEKAHNFIQRSIEKSVKINN